MFTKMFSKIFTKMTKCLQFEQNDYKNDAKCLQNDQHMITKMIQNVYKNVYKNDSNV